MRAFVFMATSVYRHGIVMNTRTYHGCILGRIGALSGAQCSKVSDTCQTSGTRLLVKAQDWKVAANHEIPSGCSRAIFYNVSGFRQSQTHSATFDMSP